MNASARILFFKAEQLGLFGVSTPVKGYVSKKTGKRIAPYTGIRHQAVKKPQHPLSGHLFAQAPDAMAADRPAPPHPALASGYGGKCGNENSGGKGNGGDTTEKSAANRPTLPVKPSAITRPW